MNSLCLVNPPHPYLTEPDAQAPAGLLYVAAQAEAEGHTVTIWNLSAETAIGTPPHADVYGITGTYLDAAWINKIAFACKARSVGKARVVVGGPVALSPETLDSGAIDCIVQGEGEGCVSTFMQSGPVPSRIRCEGWPLDDIPTPARHLWPGDLGGNVFAGNPWFEGGSTTVVTSRGCPHSCAFCASQALTSRKVRCRKPEAVVAELEQCVADFGVRQFRFSDEYLTAKRDHIEGICAGIRSSKRLGYGRGIAWRCSICVNPHDQDLFDTMREAGCREVSFGVESADPDVLEALDCHKGTVEDAYEAIATARRCDLMTRALMMVGTPGETKKTAVENIRFLHTADYDRVAIAVFHPLPGTPVYENPAAYGCSLAPMARSESVCLYGPHGMNRIRPTIELDGMSTEELRCQMQLQIAVANAIGKLNSGASNPAGNGSSLSTSTGNAPESYSTTDEG